MKKIKSLPTLLGIFILLVGVAAGVWVIRAGPHRLLRARPEVTPKQIKVTNITDKSFTVSWITDAPASGFIQFGLNEEINLTAQDDRDEAAATTGEFTTHYVTLKNLQPNTNYSFKIFSGKTEFANNGQPYQVTTATAPSTPAPPNDVAYGTVLQANGTPAEGAIVYLSLSNAVTQSALTKNSGSWLISLNTARDSRLANYATYDLEASIEEILVQAAGLGTATAVTITKNDSPVPDITLGQTHDFRETSPKTQAPQTPTPTGPLKSFSTTQSPLEIEGSKELTIINPEADETISTTKPEFWGAGPAGETITIEIHSDQIISSTVTINENGVWFWSPPQDLTPGQHTITISLPDGQTINRFFTVLAAGEDNQPAFTATQSATTTTPTPTNTPTVTPTTQPVVSVTATPTVTRVSQPSTENGIPESGILTPTLLLIIMGSGLFFSGLLFVFNLKKNHHA